MNLGSIVIEDIYKLKANEDLSLCWTDPRTGNSQCAFFPAGMIFYGSKPLGNEIKTTFKGTAADRYSAGQAWLDVPMDKVTILETTNKKSNNQNQNNQNGEPITKNKNMVLYIAGAALVLFLLIKK